MTEQEAIKELRNIRPRGGIIPQKRAEAIDVAIKAIEKQIPKELEEKEGYRVCPVCGKIVGSKANYCKECGQRVTKWTKQ